jgi:NAD(P)-dependent dehydrogenase (short-subunit alcohol dehydrogenase family)
MVALAEEKFGKLDILFNKAGIMHSDDENAMTTEENVWDLTMNVNAKGVFMGCKYGIPAIKRAGGGSIINTASFVAILGPATPQIAYTASKGAVLAMTREWATIHAREGIRVNPLCPGPLRTELWMKFLNTEEKSNADWYIFRWGVLAKLKKWRMPHCSWHNYKKHATDK